MHLVVAPPAQGDEVNTGSFGSNRGVVEMVDVERAVGFACAATPFAAWQLLKLTTPHILPVAGAVVSGAAALSREFASEYEVLQAGSSPVQVNRCAGNEKLVHTGHGIVVLGGTDQQRRGGGQRRPQPRFEFIRPMWLGGSIVLPSKAPSVCSVRIRSSDCPLALLLQPSALVLELVVLALALIFEYLGLAAFMFLLLQGSPWLESPQVGRGALPLTHRLDNRSVSERA